MFVYYSRALPTVGKLWRKYWGKPGMELDGGPKKTQRFICRPGWHPGHSVRISQNQHCTARPQQYFNSLFSSFLLEFVICSRAENWSVPPVNRLDINPSFYAFDAVRRKFPFKCEKKVCRKWQICQSSFFFNEDRTHAHVSNLSLETLSQKWK